MERRKDRPRNNRPKSTSFRPELPRVGVFKSGCWLGVLLIGQCLCFIMLWLSPSLSLIDWPVLVQVFLLALLVSALAGSLVWRIERKVWAVFGAHKMALSYTVLVTALALAVLAIELTLFAVFAPLFHHFTMGEAVVAALLLAVMLTYYLHIQRQIVTLSHLLEASRIQELQSRIRPHFLFNSMNMIASLIAIDPGKAELVVVDLARLFRRVLDDAYTLVPLREELALCRSYLALEKLRLGERLQTEWELGDYGDVQIPSLTLQPVLENAVYHGIELLPEGGLIKISVKRINERLILTVANPRSLIMQHSRGSKMAIDNVQKRLVAHFGPTAVVRAERMDNHYITHINFPLG